jgi:hypothetical protein
MRPRLCPTRQAAAAAIAAVIERPFRGSTCMSLQGPPTPPRSSRDGMPADPDDRGDDPSFRPGECKGIPGQRHRACPVVRRGRACEDAGMRRRSDVQPR